MNEDTSTVFLDAVMLALLGFVAMVVIMLPHLNPPTREQEAESAGNVTVEVRWADGLTSDVDLWVKGPGDAPVGYSRKSGRLFDLLRDDLGISRDITDLNYEFAFSRGAPAGEYVVNLHLYGTGHDTPPIDVLVVVSVRNPVSGDMTTVGAKTVALHFRGEEVTVLRFTLDNHAHVVPGSVHDLPMPLRTAGVAP